MDVMNWLLSIRKKPLAERRKFVTVVTLLITGGITLIWLILFIAVGPFKKDADAPRNQLALPTELQEIFDAVQ